MAKKKKGGFWPWIIIALLAIFLFKDKISFGEGDSDICGDNGVDTERSGYCLTTNADYDGLIIVTGNTRNSSEPNLDFKGNEELASILKDVFYNDGSVTIISAAGTNQAIPFTSKYRPRKNLNASKNDYNKLADEINKSIKASPSEAGADYFGALQVAENEIKAKGYSRPIIIITGSGYSDRGVFDFAHDDIIGKYSLGQDIDMFAAQDSSIRQGALSGVPVKWYEMGATVPPQDTLDSDYKNKTINFYRDLLKYLGANATVIGASGNSTQKSVESKYSVGQVYVDKLKKGDSFNANEDVGRFKSDEATLLNYEEAKGKLRSFAARFDSSSDLRLKVTGYIAVGGGCHNGSNLGYQRAAVIKNILVELGVPADKIDVYGQPGAPSNSGKAYECSSDMPPEEQRTVMIEVIGS